MLAYVESLNVIMNNGQVNNIYLRFYFSSEQLPALPTYGVLPVNMPDLIRKRFCYGHLWPLRPACSRIGPHRVCLVRLPASVSDLFFQRRHGSYCTVTKPTRIRSGWPCQGLAKCIWSGSRSVCRNHRAWFWGERNRPATSFSISGSVAIIHRRPGRQYEKPARIRFSSG